MEQQFMGEEAADPRRGGNSKKATKKISTDEEPPFTDWLENSGFWHKW